MSTPPSADPPPVPVVTLRRGRVLPLLERHPWVYAGSVDGVEGAPADGDVVEVRAPDGRFVARGFWAGPSALRVRVFAWQRAVEPDVAWFRARLRSAVAMRRDVLGLPDDQTSAVRLVHGEADGLPGLVVDRYGACLVLQITSAGIDRRREALLAAIAAELAPQAVYEAPADRLREAEGLAPSGGLLKGDAPPDDRGLVRERGLTFGVDLAGGQKTGLYLDQRENRARVESLARGRRVLDGMCYTGGFALSAARGGAAEVVAVDSSKAAIEAAQANATHNGLTIDARREDLFKHLGRCRAEGRQYDLVILDPPPYARRTADRKAGQQKLRELLRLGLAATAPGGVLVACSCSAATGGAGLDDALRRAALDTKVDLRVFARGAQAADHPVSPHCPEGRYLEVRYCALSGHP